MASRIDFRFCYPICSLRTVLVVDANALYRFNCYIVGNAYVIL